MKTTIEEISPDGLEVKFQTGFVFDTWKEAFEFIEKVNDAYHNL